MKKQEKHYALNFRYTWMEYAEEATKDEKERAEIVLSVMRYATDKKIYAGDNETVRKVFERVKEEMDDMERCGALYVPVSRNLANRLRQEQRELIAQMREESQETEQ